MALIDIGVMPFGCGLAGGLVAFGTHAAGRRILADAAAEGRPFGGIGYNFLKVGIKYGDADIGYGIKVL